MKIDLRNCEKGDILISSHGAMLEYISPTPWQDYTYLDHVVKYVKRSDGSFFTEGNYGTRTHEGYVYKNSRNPEVDNDIIEIIKPSEYFHRFDELINKLLKYTWNNEGDNDTELQDVKIELMDFYKDEVIEICFEVFRRLKK